MNKPATKPTNPSFSSGPCAKRPGWSLDALSGAFLGRSHRSGPGKVKLKEVIETHRELLGVPADYKIAVVPASDTGAVEMAMWSMLGARGTDVLVWENFGKMWAIDAEKQLKLDDLRVMSAEYGEMIDLDAVDTDRDVIFTWNGTTSGVRVPHADWIKDNREGLTICDATSAVFAYDLPWEKLDVTTWSWQKVLGGEAAHGMLVLSPRAVERLETYKPPRGLPKIFRMVKDGALMDEVFEGLTINTPSMLAVEDCLDTLAWVKSLGGLSATIKRCQSNCAALAEWVAQTDWIDFLAADKDIRSTTSVCLKIVDPWFATLSDDEQTACINQMAKMLEAENAAFDIKAYRSAPSGLRIWCGATVETADIKALTPWLDWAFAEIKIEKGAQAA